MGVEQAHDLIVDVDVSHGVVVRVVGGRMSSVNVVGHHTLTCGQLTEEITMLQRDVPQANQG